MKTLDDLQYCASINVLREALLEICRAYGEVRRLEILKAVHEGQSQAICFITMATEAQEIALMQSLGVGRFGGEIVFVIEMENTSGDGGFGASSEWADLDFRADGFP